MEVGLNVSFLSLDLLFEKSQIVIFLVISSDQGTKLSVNVMSQLVFLLLKSLIHLKSVLLVQLRLDKSHMLSILLLLSLDLHQLKGSLSSGITSPLVLQFVFIP